MPFAIYKAKGNSYLTCLLLIFKLAVVIITPSGFVNSNFISVLFNKLSINFMYNVISLPSPAALEVPQHNIFVRSILTVLIIC